MKHRTLWLSTLGTASLAIAAVTAIGDGHSRADAPLAAPPAQQMTPLAIDRPLELAMAEQPADPVPDAGPNGNGPMGGPGMDRERPFRPMDEGGGPHHGPRGMEGMGPGGPGGPPNFRAPSADTQGRYMELVQRYGELSKDPSLTGVSAVLTANELLRARGTQAGIDYFKRLLPEVKDTTVQRAIRLMLIDLYRRAGQNDAALAEAEALIRNQPTTQP